jgi:UDP-glucose 4-epimerase
MTILITGGAGFIGSNLTNFYLSKGQKVIVLDDFSTGKTDNLTGNLGNQNLTLVEGSILDKKILKELLEKASICLHLAGSLGVFNIINKSLEALDVNLIGPKNVFQIASEFKVRTLFTSTSEIYGRNQNIPLHEQSDRILGSPEIARWTYSEAKAIDEFIAMELFKSNLFPVTIARLFNTVGVRQSGEYGMVLPRFVSAAVTNQPLVVFGDGTQSRSFCAISDVVTALDSLVTSQRTIGQAYNVGSSEEISIKNLALKVIEITNSNSRVVYKPFSAVYGEKFEETYRRVPDISKIIESINWIPETSLDQVILEIATSMKHHEF